MSRYASKNKSCASGTKRSFQIGEKIAAGRNPRIRSKLRPSSAGILCCLVPFKDKMKKKKDENRFGGKNTEKD